ncbi:MAG: DNA gyrase subunit A [Clostridia bacterium]|nr:DNA gyrase subunit A [Clostridia bacterium]
MVNDIVKELGTNFIEYAVAVNTDRAIPDAKSGLKPVAKRILYDAYASGFSSAKPYVKCALIVGDTMGRFHPHGDSSIYGALARLSQDWVMRYPLIDFHGSVGNRDGDGPASMRYTEARLAKITEDGMLVGMKKGVVDTIPNYSETESEPVTLPSVFPNLLCNPNTGIGVAMACNWAPHNLNEVAQAINDYIDGNEPSLPGPDFPTGGIIINAKDIPMIMRTGHGSVKIRGKYHMEGNTIVFTEIPYGVATESLLEAIGSVCDAGDIQGVVDIRNESNRKKGFRLVIECAKDANISRIISLLFQKTDLQSSFSYNQVALIDKTPTELNLKDCCKIYVDHNCECIRRETEFDIQKAKDRLNIVDGLLKALANIDDVIAIIKASESSAKAREALMKKYGFNEEQAKAITDMRLGKLAGLERLEIENEKAELLNTIDALNAILNDLVSELKKRLGAIVKKYGDARRTELTNVEETKSKEEKEIELIPPEKCVVVMTEGGSLKRIPSTSFRAQRKGGKGVKTQEDITNAVIRTNTVDSLMIFTNKGKMYRLVVNNIPEGTNTSKGTPVRALIEMEADENVATIYSIYRDTDAKYVLFITKKGLVKKTALSEYVGTKKSKGIGAINIKEGDALSAVALVKDEPLIILTKNGYAIKFKIDEVSATGRLTAGVKGINLGEDDEVVAALPVRHEEDDVAVFSEKGFGKRVPQKELTLQKRGGKGVIVYKPALYGKVSAGQLVNDDDIVLLIGSKNSICVKGSEIPQMGRVAGGNVMLKGNSILSVSKV